MELFLSTTQQGFVILQLHEFNFKSEDHDVKTFVKDYKSLGSRFGTTIPTTQGTKMKDLYKKLVILDRFSHLPSKNLTEWNDFKSNVSTQVSKTSQKIVSGFSINNSSSLPSLSISSFSNSGYSSMNSQSKPILQLLSMIIDDIMKLNMNVAFLKFIILNYILLKKSNPS